MPEETDLTSDSLEEQRALLTTIRDEQDTLHQLIEDTASRLDRLDEENMVLRAWFPRTEEHFDRRLGERVNSMDKRATTLESSRR